eukprot:CAMPEP_0170496062 /NCGR_PEP_ID=MMETSP0208-20121228/19893_1 /TAXON_ID=197538 /ORGANISM="Strombidium inclinatum, Strain S3" /LENGTH=81 /DNA_ID=CAMNT_0010772495 /DNA_START=127 /DNA_END=372 /DNA_ORIENTATION=+
MSFIGSEHFKVWKQRSIPVNEVNPPPLIHAGPVNLPSEVAFEIEGELKASTQKPLLLVVRLHIPRGCLEAVGPDGSKLKVE